MKKLIIGLMTLTSFSSIAGLNELVVQLEAKRCSSQLTKDLNKSGVRKDLRYLYRLDSHPLIHVFAVYEDQKAEAVDIVKMVKLPGQKCTRY
jgi:hypothetical protein